MIRLALVEDDAACRAQLHQFVDRYARESGESITVLEFEDGDEIALEYKAEYDIILMDIEMTFMNGMDAAEAIRKADKEVIIIFITNSPQYAIKGYAVDALDYVLKPVSYYAFSQRLARALERLHRHERRFLSVNAKDGAHKVDISRIHYLESRGHDLIYHTADGVLRATGTMQDAQKRLADDRFFLCYKGCLVNLEYVNSVQGEDIVLQGETDRVPLAKARRRDFLDALNDYISGTGNDF